MSKKIIFKFFKRLAPFLVAVFYFTTCASQSLFTTTLNSTGDSKKLPPASLRFPNYFFEWSVGESTIITTNTNGNLQVTHGLLQWRLLNNPTGPNNRTWNPDEIKIYPNPVITDFTLELLTGLKGVVEYHFYNSSGTVIFTRYMNYQGTGQTERFNIGYLPSGSYILSVTLRGFPETGGNVQKQGGFKIIKIR